MQDAKLIVQSLRQKQQRDDLAWQEQMKEQQRQFAARQAQFQKEVLPYLRSAKPEEYAAWLKDFIETGGEPTHCYDYPMPKSFYVAVSDFRLPPLCGSESVCVIVPEGISVTYTNIGHNTIFFVDGSCYAGIVVPVYSNTL